MKKLLTITGISLSLTLLNYSYLLKDAQGQIDIKPNVDIKTPTINDLGIPDAETTDETNIDNLPIP